jgi:hypothetical protein
VRYEANDHRFFVQLTDSEYRGACDVGRWMYEKSHADGRSDAYGFDGDGERIQILGSLCERAAAKALGIYWPGAIDQGDAPDLAFGVEVRLMGRDWYGLRLRPKDHDHRPNVGVVIEPGREAGPYRIPGWIIAGDGKRPEWMMAPNGRLPMYAVPQSSLRPLAELHRWIGRPAP